VENSLYPLGRGAVFFTHSQNEFNAIPEILHNHGYYSASLHANNKSFWNRDIMYHSLGYDRFYDISDYEVDAFNSVTWGLKDKPFFKQSIKHLQQMPLLFFTKFITLTNHFPFTLSVADRSINEYNSASSTLNKYFPTVRYTDEALQQFFTDLKVAGIYDNSIIVLYGDHIGISENHNTAMSKYLGKEITPFDSVQLQRVPLIIHIPGLKGKTMDVVSGQIDLRPTILHLLGITNEQQIEFGTDLFSKRTTHIIVLRNSSFITQKYVFTRDTCYDRNNGELMDKKACEPFIKQSKDELQYSDKIIYGDLIRFSKKATN
jgi:lipoteichoic acid synthase